ncbi:MAG: molecular chaperone DnaK [Eubacterium sp.]|nr:molecular chaperone DnaK [Eubacterium sp.]
MGKVIGIDLGTTNSCAAVIENDEPVIIPNNVGGRTTPSIVAFTKFGEILVGDPAKRQLATNPTRTFTSIKRQMGSTWSVNVDGKKYNPQMISAFILMQLKKDAEAFTGGPVKDAVITVPAYFTDAQRQATKDAGKIAGLNVLRIINEPTSAALSYGLNHGESTKVMVYDLGGGTFEVSVIEIEDGVISVLATSGDNHLGGDDFDDRIASYIVSEFKASNQVDLSKDPIAFNRVKEAAEAAKKELSTSETTNINLPFVTVKKGEPLHLDINLSRSKFDALTSDLVERTAGPVRAALADAGISPSALSRVLLVGGSTRIPAVQKKVRELTGREPSKNINPDECVAMGAAIMGSTLGGNAIIAKDAGKSLLLLDVTPMSLSIETIGGLSTVLIERNTTIPTRVSKVFTTSGPYASSVEIHVLQGERPMSRDNKTIGRFMLRGIRRAPAGVPQIEVTFDIDANGILKVSARDLDTGRQQSVTINADDRMTDAEIEQAMRDAQMNMGVDMVKRETADVANECRNLTMRVDRALSADRRNTSREEKKRIKDDRNALEKVMRSIRPENANESDLARLKEAKAVLENSAADLLARTGM